MKKISSLDQDALTALKTALDGLQRFDSDGTIHPYFRRIINALLGSTDDINVWAIRELINKEDERRSRRTTLQIADPDAFKRIKSLGPQEIRVMKLIGEGYHNEAIAGLLSINIRTVANHKTNIASKLGLATVRDLPRFAQANLTVLQ
ncbi:response regulator transcription factor [Spirosoma endophyticum]|uniref:Regulatory protein, luxR family n=1 Tax=Spirosoma endophyticum TaxID=662367 RepID=A0A1I1SLX7_9BACT|nr:LuxR family transcriptional regulator [Spirosoma endophyticum]SFD47479.1 regulatory protein, luxR family [Spirosoma endophyticum]